MADFTGHQKGFSVVELMIVLAVAAILLATAVPSFNETIQNNRLTTQVNELHAGLSLARSEAVKRNANITVCKSSDGNSCTGDWEDGWIIFQDNDVDGAVDEGDEILRVNNAAIGTITIAFSEDELIYRGNGLARSGANATFTLCDARGASSAKALVIGPSGRPRLAMDSNDDGKLEDYSKQALNCS